MRQPFHLDILYIDNFFSFSLFGFFSIIAVSSANVDDVRDVLQYYKQFDSPLAQFKENQRILLQQLQEKQLEEKQTPIVKRWTPSFASRT